MTKSSRIGTAKNLEVGGNYDLLLIKFEGTFPEGNISFGLYDTPMKITGVQKVAQLFMKLLLTSKGSDPFFPNRGTNFPNLTIGANQLTDDPTYLSDLTSSIKDAESQAKYSSSVGNVDVSSILDYVEVLGLDKIPEGVVIYVAITTLAGVTASIAMPFPEFGLGQV